MGGIQNIHSWNSSRPSQTEGLTFEEILKSFVFAASASLRSAHTFIPPSTFNNVGNFDDAVQLKMKDDYVVRGPRIEASREVEMEMGTDYSHFIRFRGKLVFVFFLLLYSERADFPLCQCQSKCCIISFTFSSLTSLVVN